MTTNGNGKRPLPDGWKWTTIGEVAKTTSGGTPLRKHPEYYGGSIPWVKSGELGDSIVTSVEETITEVGLRNSSAKVFPKGTALVALYGATVGKTGILGLDAATNQAVCAIFPEDGLFTAKYMTYWLRSQRDTLIGLSAGGAQPNISQGIIKAFPFPLAPLPVQERIVAEIEKQFTRLDTAVSILNRLQSNLDRYQASLLKAACTGQLLPQDANDEPADRLLQRILAERRQRWLETEWQNQIERAQKKAAQAQRKAAGRPHHIRDLDPADWQSIPEAEYAPYLPQNDKWQMKYKEPAAAETADLPDLPSGWVWARFEQLVSLSQNGSGKRNSNKGQPTIVLRLADIDNGMISLENVRRIRLTDDELQKYKLKENDLLCIRVNGSADLVGRMIPVGELTETIAFCDHFIRFRFTFPDVTPFLSFYFNTHKVRRYIELNKVSSAGQNTVSQGIVSNIVVPLPPIAEQKRIVAEVERRLSVVTATQQAISANLTRSGRLRQSILQQAFNGRLV
jgi:type I restriction enzyme, S subunit